MLAMIQGSSNRVVVGANVPRYYKGRCIRRGMVRGTKQLSEICSMCGLNYVKKNLEGARCRCHGGVLFVISADDNVFIQHEGVA